MITSNYKGYISLSLIVAIFFGSIHPSYINARSYKKSPSFLEDVFTGAAMAGAAYGAYKVCNWLTRESTEAELIYSSEQLYDRLVNRYRRIIDSTEQVIDSSRGAQEDTLSQIYSLMTDNVKGYLYTLQSHRDEIRRIKNDLADRRRRLEKDLSYDPYLYDIVQDIKIQEKRLHTIDGCLARTYDYIKVHSDYFIVHDQYERIKNRYSSVLSIINSRDRDSHWGYDSIDHFVRSSTYVEYPYSYLPVYKKVNRDYDHLQLLKNNVALRYHTIHDTTQRLLDSLAWLKEWMITSRHYRQEYQRYYDIRTFMEYDVVGPVMAPTLTSTIRIDIF